MGWCETHSTKFISKPSLLAGVLMFWGNMMRRAGATRIAGGHNDVMARWNLKFPGRWAGGSFCVLWDSVSDVHWIFRAQVPVLLFQQCWGARDCRRPCLGHGGGKLKVAGWLGSRFGLCALQRFSICVLWSGCFRFCAFWLLFPGWCSLAVQISAGGLGGIDR